MGKAVWTITEARAKLSQVIERAEKFGPQRITRHGKEAVIVVSAEEWRRKTRREGNLVEFFAESPLRGSGLEIKRIDDEPRETKL